MEISRRIEKEQKMWRGTQLISQATTNPDVLRRNEAQMKAIERSLAYFEEAMRELQARKAQQDDLSRFPGSLPPQVLSFAHSTVHIFLLIRIALPRFPTKTMIPPHEGDTQALRKWDTPAPAQTKEVPLEGRPIPI